MGRIRNRKRDRKTFSVPYFGKYDDDEDEDEDMIYRPKNKWKTAYDLNDDDG